MPSEREFAVSRVTTISEWLLRQSLIWGGLACLAFYAFYVEGMRSGLYHVPILRRALDQLQHDDHLLRGPGRAGD